MERNTPFLISLPKIQDIRGSLSFVESETHIPFKINRVYFIYDVPGGESRGEHAHKKLCQVLIAVSGGMNITLDDGAGYIKSFYLSKPYEGLYIPSGYWRKLHSFTSGAVCLTLASEVYDESDYIRNYDDFLTYKGKK